MTKTKEETKREEKTKRGELELKRRERLISFEGRMIESTEKSVPIPCLQ